MLIAMISHESLRNWKRTLLVFSLPAIIWIGVIYITYGTAFNPFLAENNSMVDVFKLPNQLTLFSSDISIPIIVKTIGKVSVVILMMCFVLWLVVFTIYSYVRLVKQLPGKIELLLELLFLSAVYFLLISPSNIYWDVLGWIIVVLNYLLIGIYFIYELKIGR